jgi:quinol monooxygenase YgiN
VFPPVAAAAAAALLTLALQLKLPVNSGYAAVCLAAAVLTWFAGHRSRRVQLADLHEAAPAGDDTGWGEAYTDTGTGTGYGLYRPDTGRVGSDTDFGGLYRPDTGGSGRVSSDTDFGGLYRPDTGGIREVSSDSAFRDIGSDTGYGFYRTDSDLRPVVSNGADRPPHSEPVPGIIETGDILPVSFDVFTPAARRADGQATEETERLYGQIAIYTLIDGQAEEFDQLAQAVVEKVKALEPGTLAFIVHGVPSAPLQRILYEVYRDETAFEEHGQQPYIQDFEEERKPYVLATNVIELGVRQAKLSPLGGPAGGPAGPPAGPSRPGPPAWRGRPGPQAQPGGTPPRGRPGPQGRAGPPGEPVPPGRSRPPVPPGDPGSRSRPGPPGDGRSRGRPGPPGDPSPRGRPGPPGDPAPRGRPGPPGDPSPRGRPGPPDESAPRGRPGPPVPPGVTAPRGRPGPYDQPGPRDGQPARPRSNGSR